MNIRESLPDEKHILPFNMFNYEPLGSYLSPFCNYKAYAETDSAGKNILEFGGKLFKIVSQSDSSKASTEHNDEKLQRRAQREFVPEERKDTTYWNKRVKNNDSARKSRLKRKALEQFMEQRLMKLQTENMELKMELAALKRQVGMKTQKNRVGGSSITGNVQRNTSTDHETFRLGDNVEERTVKKFEVDFSDNDRRWFHSSRFNSESPSGSPSIEGSCSPGMSECNEYRNSFGFPLDLSSSASSSPELREMNKMCTDEKSLTETPSFDKLPLKFRIKMYEHSAFKG